MTTQFSVTQNDKPLAKSKYKWDEKTRTFSTDENYLVIDFGCEVEITFNTGFHCTFKTGSECTFNTGSDCTFKTGPSCTFKTGDSCFTTRFDVKGVTEIPEDKTIKLNGNEVVGYTIVEKTHTIVVDGKTIELSEQSFNEFKEQFKD